MESACLASSQRKAAVLATAPGALIVGPVLMVYRAWRHLSWRDKASLSLLPGRLRLGEVARQGSRRQDRRDQGQPLLFTAGSMPGGWKVSCNPIAPLGDCVFNVYVEGQGIPGASVRPAKQPSALLDLFPCRSM